MIIQLIGYGIIGWLVGILINHVATILPHRETIWQKPRCFQCHTPRPHLIAWSALLQGMSSRTACPHCGTVAETQRRAIIVEILTAILFIFLLYRYQLGLALLIISIHSTFLLLITVTDLEHRYIYNVVIVPAILFGLLTAFVLPLSGFWLMVHECGSLFYRVFTFYFFTPHHAWEIAILGGALGFGLSFLAYLLGNLAYGHGALGSGDVTLSTYLGLIVGIPYILLTLFFAVFLGALIPLFLMAIGKVSRKSYIPYGPFLTITGWVMLIWGDEVWRYFYC